MAEMDEQKEAALGVLNRAAEMVYLEGPDELAKIAESISWIAHHASSHRLPVMFDGEEFRSPRVAIRQNDDDNEFHPLGLPAVAQALRKEVGNLLRAARKYLNGGPSR
jgi:hypothetical protein